MSNLDITKLIESAEELVHSGQMDFAAQGQIKVQEIENEDEDVFELFVVMRIKQDDSPKMI